MAISRPYNKKSPKKTTRKYTKKPKMTMKMQIKAAITRTMEKKIYAQYAQNTVINSVAGSSISLCPTPAQGAGANQRIGNQITVVKAVIHGRVNILPYNSTSNPLSTAVLVKIFLCKSKSINGPNFSAIYNVNNDFFDVGGSKLGFQSNVLDMLLTVNKNNWTWCATKAFKIGASYPSASGPVGSGGYYDNSSMSVPFMFDYSKHLHTLRFDDSSPYALNDNLFLVFQAVYADGSASSLAPAEFHYVTRVDYIDA